MPLLGHQEKCLPSPRKAEAESSGRRDRPAAPRAAGVGGQACRWDFFWTLNTHCSPAPPLKIQEESVAILQGTGAHPFLTGSVFIPLAFKPRNLPKASTCKKGATSVSTGSSLIKPPRLNRLLININPPNQSHAQKTLDEETQESGRSLQFSSYFIWKIKSTADLNKESSRKPITTPQGP